MGITSGKTNQVLVGYKDIGGKDKIIEVTDWLNGDGCTVTIGDDIAFSITHDDWNALQLAMISTSVSLTKDGE